MNRTYGKNKIIVDEDKNDLTIKSAVFLANLKKNDEFSIGDKNFVVTLTTKKTLRIKSDNNTYSFKPEFFEKYSVWITNSGKGYDKGEQLLRDIEGILMIDNINKYNPFHVESDIYVILKRDELYKLFK